MTVALREFPILRGVCRAIADSGGELADLSDVELFEAVVAAAEWVGDPIPVDERLAPLAAAVGERLRAGWFAEVTPGREQARFSAVAEPIDIALTRPPLDSTAVIDDKPRGAWWTSSRLPDGTSAWSRAETVLGTPESRAAGDDATRQERWWTVDTASARIHRIESTSDYLELLERHPLAGSAVPRVDWVAAATEFDAVHLSAAGLVHTQSVPVETSRGTTALRGWNCESTAWLRAPRAERAPMAPASSRAPLA
ncbi:hypothetical protein [Actinokineospora diospyrosa]|uniref:Uncharacterized protein n=1 Tax=Actinokineospora diospyrosa TaxID=103728 RepID=A0ABT1IFY0_9PSEU|nr:hypothetical protein [Actinokineospora diospyrosa]MCP2271552.1 hypothetical protein [Actinokineospora diospyrosa]